MRFRVYDKHHSTYIPPCNVAITTDGAAILSNWLKGQMDEWVMEPISGRYIIELSTGLYDKNGTEVFEGDIVSYYRYFDGLESRPTQKQTIVIKCYMESSLTCYSSSGLDGRDVVEDVEIVGNVHNEH